MVNLLTKDRVRTLLQRLFDASSMEHNDIYDTLVMFADPIDILNESLYLYRDWYNEHYLWLAVSLLEKVGNKAWTALCKLVDTQCKECEVFVRLIAECPGISKNDRLLQLLKLFNNPHRVVKLAVLETIEDEDVSNFVVCDRSS